MIFPNKIFWFSIILAYASDVDYFQRPGSIQPPALPSAAAALETEEEVGDGLLPVIEGKSAPGREISLEPKVYQPNPTPQ